jgi:hypothetical protein
MNKKKGCGYPSCNDCNTQFVVPVCMLNDAGIDRNNDLIIIPYDGYVVIKQDEGDNE